MMCVRTYICTCTYVCTCPSRLGMSLCHVCGLRDSENLAGQRSYVILLRKRRVEPGNVRRRP